MAIQSINPATGKVEKIFEPASEVEIESVLDRAEKAFIPWSREPVMKRVAYVKRIAENLDNHTEDLANLVTREMGRVHRDSIAELKKSISICDYYTDNAERFLAETHVATESSKSYVKYAPLGVILGIMPWNFPFNQVFRALIPAIAAGNVFVLKHASNVPQCALALDGLFRKSGFPIGVFSNLFIEGGRVNKLVADDRIAAVTLTGSEAAGARVAEVAGAHLKKVVLELGGSDAFIVLDDADIEDSVSNALKGRLMNAGQACNSPKRIILVRKIADKFKKLFIKRAKMLKVGDPMDSDTDVGPMARDDLIELLENQVQLSVDRGAEVALGGKRMDRKGFFYEVTIVDEVKKGMPLYDEEVFGPVVVFITVENEEEAIAVANDTHLGLSASVWTEDVKRAHRFIDELHVGLVFVNQLVRSDPRLPFGGVKKSGFGRELGEYGIREFMNIKTIVIR